MIPITINNKGPHILGILLFSERGSRLGANEWTAKICNFKYTITLLFFHIFFGSIFFFLVVQIFYLHDKKKKALTKLGTN